jgi:bla regulator protein BlaR1
MRDHPEWRRSFLPTAGIVALAMPVFLGLITAPRLGAQGALVQSTTTQSSVMPQWQIDAGGKMAFDAASVKLNKSGDGGHNNLGQPGGHVAMTSVSLRQLMAQAYKFASLSDATNMILGMPDWASSERFDIQAEAPGNPTVDQKRLMLQSLLANRFKLAVHHETRQLPVYELAMARPGKLGPQIHPHADNTQCDDAPAGRTGAQQQSDSPSAARSPAETAAVALQQFPCGRVVGGLLGPNDRDQIRSGGRRVDMKTIAASLGGMEAMDHPILDRTGLSGVFDFTIEWNHQLQSISANPALVEASGLSLLEALRQQLGLTLKSTKGPVDVLVIDHVEQPSEN